MQNEITKQNKKIRVSFKKKNTKMIVMNSSQTIFWLIKESSSILLSNDLNWYVKENEKNYTRVEKNSIRYYTSKMDSLLVKAPANCTRIKSRFRAARNNFLSFNSKHRQNNNGRNSAAASSSSSSSSHLKINQHQKHHPKINHIRNNNINRIRNNKTNQRTTIVHHLPRKILDLECITNNNDNSSTTNLNANETCAGHFTR